MSTQRGAGMRRTRGTAAPGRATARGNLAPATAFGLGCAVVAIALEVAGCAHAPVRPTTPPRPRPGYD
ncbi:MAG TPA: hypothetical protein VL123_01425, partial [Candidatus Udaeobacter sp.]|nr:hypothetical protein [Candidatus Udaeobacter sp.]